MSKEAPFPYKLACDLMMAHSSPGMPPMHPQTYERIVAALDAPDAPRRIDWSEVVRRGLAEREER